MIHMPLLPYSLKDLEPQISWDTMTTHYGKHLRGYVSKLNSLIAGTHLDDAPLTELVRVGRGEIFNNAAQVWNHDLFFKGLKRTPIESAEPIEIPNPLAEMINKSFGSFEEFVSLLCNTSAGVFGSGWVWVCWNERSDTLEISDTSNAETPLRYGEMPILNIDLWEHAYYLDYRSDRSKFVEVCISIIDWNKINYRLEAWKLFRRTGCSL